MTTSAPLRALLIEAPVGRHFAQLHRAADTLVESVGLYVVTGLERRNGIVVIATPEHADALLRHLWYYDIDPEPLRRSGQFVLLDAAATLGQFMRHGMPDWGEFRRTVGKVLDGVQAFGGGSIRAYGEMVNVLWRDGQHDAAIRLEEYWNELARLYPFSLFCSYVLDSRDHHCYDGPLHDIGRTHSEVLATADDERFREALDRASRDVFGIPLSETLSLSGQEERLGESRLPTGQRTMLWIMRNMPNQSADILERARRYLGRESAPADSA